MIDTAATTATTSPSSPSSPCSPCRSYWWGGYEGADHVNGRGESLDMVRATGHDRLLRGDHAAARRLGLRGVRESIGWRLSERGPGRWDFSRACATARAARREGLQVLWTLMHYGLPADLSLRDDRFIPRFARFAAEAARALQPLCPAPRIYTPVNEISFLAWAASATDDMGPAGRLGDAGQEDAGIRGFEMKRRLAHAALAGMAAIREVDPDARFLHIEPVVHVVPAAETDDCRALAARMDAYQWQALDMLSGRLAPEIGGHPEALDLIGVNHYDSSQWEVPTGRRLDWHLQDPRRLPLVELLERVCGRYGRPMIVAETGHVGRGRADWLDDVASAVRRAAALGLPLLGVCLYPLLDRPDWNEPARWHRSGVWHVTRDARGAVNGRRVMRRYARALAALCNARRP